MSGDLFLIEAAWDVLSTSVGVFIGYMAVYVIMKARGEY